MFPDKVFSADDRLLFFSSLRQQIVYKLPLVLIAASAMGVLIISLVQTTSPAGLIVLWLAFELVCALAYLLRSSHDSLSLYTLLVVSVLYSLMLGLILPSTVFLNISSVIPLFSGILLRRRSGVVMVALFSVAAIVAANRLPTTQDFLGLAVQWWVMLFSGFLLADCLGKSCELRAQDERNASPKDKNPDGNESQPGYLGIVAEETRRLKAQFAANISHELRTPINLIVGFTEMILSGSGSYDEALPSAYWKDMNTICRNAEQLQKLINDVLDISRIETGQMVVVKENTDVRSVLNEAADLVRETLQDKGLEFMVQIPNQLPSIWIDRVRVRQIILSLLENAIRFTDRGHITLQTFVKDAELIISITDTGIGIPPQELEPIFEGLRQLEGSLSRSRNGSGLGLTLSRQFAELHGGRLWAESQGKTGQGSTFWLALPLESRPALMSTYPKADSQISHMGVRQFVLLDNDPAVAQLFHRHAQKHRVISVQDIDELDDLLKVSYPSAFVLDSSDTDAYETVAKMSGERDIPVIRCPMPSGQRLMHSIGISDYLPKPISRESLEGLLHKLTVPIKTILIVDDNQDLVRLYSGILQTIATNYEVLTAYSGLEALEIMRQSPPDLVIIDQLMSDISGTEVIKQMKTTPSLRDVPIFLASAYDISDPIARMVRGEIYLSRPQGFEAVELVHCVEALVDTLTLPTGEGVTKVHPVPAVS